MRRRNILALLMAAALCLCLLAGCGSAETTDSTGTSIAEAATIADLKGMKIAAQAGTFHADALNQIENVQGSTYPEFADLLTALKSGAIDGYIAEEPTAFSVCQSDDTLTFLPFMNNETGFTATASDVGIAIGLKKGSELREQINAVLAEITPEQRSALMEQIVTLSYGGEVTEFAVSAEEPENPTGTLRVGMECAYAPNNWQESEATDSNVPVENVAGAYAEGYDVQIAKAIADGLGKELVIVKLSWDGLIDALNQGQIDAIIAGMMDTAERRESINFSEPYRETTYGLMVLADSPYLNATSIQDFSGAAVLGQQGTALDDVIEQIEGVDHLSPVGSVPDMISRLQQGTCDAIVINVENAQGYLASNPNFRLVTFDEGSGFTLPAKGSCVGLRKSDNELLDQINTILSGIDDDARAAMWQAAVDGQPQ